jgi:PAS domain S-box-containing protein
MSIKIDANGRSVGAQTPRAAQLPFRLRVAAPSRLPGPTAAFLCACLGFFSLAVPLAAHAANDRPAPHKRILFLSSYRYGRAGTDTLIRTYADSLVQSGFRNDDLMVEHLNLNFNDGAEAKVRLRELLLQRYTTNRPDLIVALQQPALTYALTSLRPLTAGVPLLAINANAAAAGSPGGKGIAILEQSTTIDFAGTLRQALALFPGTRRVLVTAGVSDADQDIKRQIERAAAPWSGKLAIDYLDTLTLAQMLARVGQPAPGTIVICGVVNRDREGALTVPLQFAGDVARHAGVPVFALYNTVVGSGAVGGSVLSIEDEARRLAATSLALLDGSLPPSQRTGVLPAQHVPMYDWAQLTRWGADTTRLPSGALLVNRPPSLWQEHRASIVSTLAAFGALIVLLTSLLLQRRRLRRARHEISESEARYRILVEYASEAILVYDLDLDRIIDANSKTVAVLGYSLEELRTLGTADFYMPEQPGLDGGRQALMDSVAANAARIMQGEPVTVERLVRRRDGSAFSAEVRMVKLPAAGRRLLRSAIVDISERKRAEEELLQYRDHLEELVQQRTAALSVAVADAEAANRAKSIFLANMSHELRTPLNSVIGFSQLMADSGSMQDEEKRNLAIINRAGYHLLTLINDILELSKIEAGRIQLQPAVIDVGDMLREMLDMLRARSLQAGLTLHLETSGLPQLVRADGAKLRQILLNLLSNALKFVEHGSVTLAACGKPVAGEDALVELTFSVRDTGAGIAAADQRRIFAPFIQVDGAAKQAGTGLGLTISREFVHLMGGELGLTSAPGEGADFFFSIVVPRERSWRAPAASHGRVLALPPEQRGKLILLADDNDDCHLLLSALLLPLGFELHAVRDGAAAMAALRTLRPALVLADWRMPLVDGLALTRWLRGHGGMAHLPVVIMTASAFEEERREALAAGADAFLRKPIEQDKLFAVLEQQLGLQFIRREEAAGADNGSAVDNVADAEPLRAADLAALAPALRRALMPAVRELDLGQAAAILARIAQEQPYLAGLAERLGTMIARHQYLVLWQLLQEAERNPDEAAPAAGIAHS